MSASLYSRLGGYDAISAVVDDLLPRLQSDPQLARFWQNRATDSVRREKQLLIDYLSACSGGPLMYVGRDMKASHSGMGITEADWTAFLGHAQATLAKFNVPAQEGGEVAAFVSSLKADIIDQPGGANSPYATP